VDPASGGDASLVIFARQRVPNRKAALKVFVLGDTATEAFKFDG
jgi:hypothetical protein